MEKVKLGAKSLVNPMPAFIIGADVDGKPNFMVASWSGIACSEPPMISVAIQPNRHTYKGIKANRTFSVNVPPVALMRETDYCGIYSGKDEPGQAEKLGFEVFYGDTPHAPMVGQCGLNLECTVVMTLELGKHDLVIGRINEVHASSSVLGEDGSPDPAKVDPLIFSVPDRTYRRMGDVVGKAFKAGNELKDK